MVALPEIEFHSSCNPVATPLFLHRMPQWCGNPLKNCTGAPATLSEVKLLISGLPLPLYGPRMPRPQPTYPL